MIPRDQLVSFLDTYLDAHAGKDYGPNGLQVQGNDEIGKIVTGVSAGIELFERAVELGADAVLVHHGIFWNWQSPVLVGPHFERVKLLLDARVNLLAYHLPLDRHLEVGNNGVAARALGLHDLEPFGDHAGLPVGFSGRLPEPIAPEELQRRAEAFYEREALAFLAGPREVRSVGVISGGAQKELETAIAAGLDAFVTGEVSEWVMNMAKEAGIHFLSCGHYATERCGIQALGDLVARRFDVEVEYVEVPNPV